MAAAMPMTLIGIALAGAAPAQSAPCPVQPPPPAIDSAGEVDAGNAIEFAATPSLAYPRRAWVVRLFRRGRETPATVEVLRLRLQQDCNRYDVENRWQAPLGAAAYAATAEAIAPFATPAGDTFTHGDAMRDLDGLALDGVGLAVRLRATGWQVERSLNYHGRDGAGISAIFHGLAARYVPRSEMPTLEWREARR